MTDAEKITALATALDAVLAKDTLFWDLWGSEHEKADILLNDLGLNGISKEKEDE